MAKVKKKSILANTKPTIGIIGGCGVLATIDIEKEVIKAAQRLMHPLIDQDYPNLLVYQYTQFHDRNDAICFNGSSPDKQYVKCANELVSIGAQVLLFACNTAHAYIEYLKKRIKIPIIDIIQETVKSTINRFPHIEKIGLLSTDATNKENLYQKAFAPYKVSVVTPNASFRKQVMQAIYLIKAGINDKTYLRNDCLEGISRINNHPHKKVLAQKYIPNPCELVNKAIQCLSDKGCTHIILGCTELPMVINNIKVNINGNKLILINPNKIVAEAVIKFCITN